MKRFFRNLAYSFTSLLIIGALLLNNVPVVTAEDRVSSTPNSDSLLACGWVKEYDDTSHWERCINHSDTGEYNGVQHNEGKRNIQQHNFIVEKQPKCYEEGIKKCKDCNYTTTIPTTPHNIDGVSLTNGWRFDHCYKCKNENCSGYVDKGYCSLYFKTPPTFSNDGNVYSTLGCKNTNICSKVESLQAPCKDYGNCKKGGKHIFKTDIPNFSFETVDSNYCGLRCEKCNELIPLTKHAFSGTCKHCNYKVATAETISKDINEQANTVTIGIKVNCEYYELEKGFADVYITGEPTQHIPFEFKGNIGYLTIKRSTTNYTISTLASWGYTKDGYKIDYNYFYGITTDVIPPTINTVTVTPKNSANGWSNIGILSVTATDLQSGDCQVAIYDGSTCIKDWTAMSKSGDTYTASMDFYGDFSIARNLTVKVRDQCKVTAQTVALANNIESVAPLLSFSIKDIGVGTATIIVTADDGNGSGVNRIKLPNRTFVLNSTCEYKVNSNGSYTFRAEDNIGNARTKVVNLSDVIDYISADITYQDFILSSEGFSGGSLQITNTSAFPINLTLKQINPLQTDFVIVPPNTYSDLVWSQLGLADSKKYIALGIQDNDTITWLNNTSKFEISLLPNQTKVYQIKAKTGRSFNQKYTLKYEFVFDIEKVSPR